MNKEDVIKILGTCVDPELNIDVWTLGLIYDISVNDKNVNILMTFTSPFCPYGPMMVEDIKNQLKEGNFENVEIKVTFDPAWEPSEELKEMLGF